MKLAAPLLAASMALAACSAQIAAFPTPPPLPRETIPLPPVSEQQLVWQPGDWVYAGGSYRYDPGRYVPSTGRERGWLFGHWTGTRGDYTWVPGGWTS